MDATLLAVAVERLAGVDAISPSPATTRGLTAAGLSVAHVELSGTQAGTAAGVVLLDDELARAGDHADEVLARATVVLAGGGLLVVGARGAVHEAVHGVTGAGRAFRSHELARTLGHHGYTIELLCSPGAARALAGAPPAYDPRLDREPGLLEAGPHLVAVGRRYPDDRARSAAFFASLPRKVVAAAVVCTDEHARLLVVHDTFKQHWTIPGGVVDADEDPRAGAERETWEEAGLRVRTGALLGLFTASWPDRLVLVYAAEASDDTTVALTPPHGHEIDEVAWVPVPEALSLLAPTVAEQVRRCLEHPGGSWHTP